VCLASFDFLFPHLACHSAFGLWWASGGMAACHLMRRASHIPSLLNCACIQGSRLVPEEIAALQRTHLVDPLLLHFSSWRLARSIVSRRPVRHRGAGATSLCWQGAASVTTQAVGVTLEAHQSDALQCILYCPPTTATGHAKQLETHGVQPTVNQLSLHTPPLPPRLSLFPLARFSAAILFISSPLV
jgi:hypothetical protein